MKEKHDLPKIVVPAGFLKKAMIFQPVPFVFPPSIDVIHQVFILD